MPDLLVSGAKRASIMTRKQENLVYSLGLKDVVRSLHFAYKLRTRRQEDYSRGRTTGKAVRIDQVVGRWTGPVDC